MVLVLIHTSKRETKDDFFRGCIDQLIEQDIGVEVTPAEVREITEKGIRILQCKMVAYLSHTYQVGVFGAFVVY